MIARDKFKLGQQVRLTRHGIRNLGHMRSALPYDENARGYVHGFSRSPSAVIIARDGIQTPEPFHMDFWEPVHAG